MPRFKRYKYDWWADAAAIAHRADQPTTIAVDTETTGGEFYDEVFCATVSWRSPEGVLA